MYIKSLVLDGFKTYGKRTEISGFDREFNAITGLNGTGKSNILDSICFVLGITNVAQVRANILQDLIYKKGQTGVQAASVTITFDNSDKRQSPVGYENYKEITVCRQVVLNGKNKYLVNGTNATNHAVKDLFCSVQLNVNNPHFLVMQGRITKVLNMKSKEILSMVEEASGTSMFEQKKRESEIKLQKKDQKLEQIDKVINEDIRPKLEHLKMERSQYMEFKKVERELEHNQKLYIAWSYCCSKKSSTEGNEHAEKIIAKIAEKKERIKAGQEEIDKINASVDNLRKQMDSDSGGNLGLVESHLGAETSKLNEVVGAQKQNHDNIEDEKKIIKELEKHVKDDERVLAGKKTDLDKIESTFQRLAEQEETDKRALEAARQKFQAISAGMEVDEEGNQGTLQDKLIAAQRAVADAKIQIETITRKKPHSEAELKSKTSEMNKLDAELKKDNLARDKLEKEVSSLRAQLAAYDELKEEERSINLEASKLRRQRDTFEQRDGRLSFRYQDPEPGFSRKSVHGLVCRLIEVDDLAFAQAIEKTAGGRLFNVVVDTDVTSRKLLKNGKLERRTTIIPLNKISGRRLNPRVVQAAERVAGQGNVWPALSLIRYSNVLEPAMEYIFGTTLICRDIATAKKVCYHPDVKARCVTLDGDVCDPSGTLSGGAPERTQPILPMLQELRELLKALDVKDIRLAEIDREVRAFGGNKDPSALKRQLDGLEDQLCAVAARLHLSDQIRTDVQALKAEVDEMSKRFAECENIVKKETKTISEVQSKIGKTNRESMLKSADGDVKKLTTKAAQSRKEVLKRKDEYDSLKLELSELGTQISTNKDLIDKHKDKLNMLQAESVDLGRKVQEAKSAVDEARSELKTVKDVINKKSKEIQKILQGRDKILKEATALELEIKQDDKDYEKFKNDAKDSKARVADLLRQHDWIAQEEQFFGKAGGVFDFEQTDPREAGKRVAALKERKDKLGRTLNTKAMNLLVKTEEQYDDLLKRRKQVELDKCKIREVIQELGIKKQEVLKGAYVQVNRDFSEIFKSLLPGADAKLVLCNPDSILDGLEFKVGFGGTWKESLTELSGGQRSLVALSLILAMLRFKPAPIYVLDEIDAALDVSHTQNIGNMLKTHFKTSQFIIVSLKDGMFSNANVLFSTKLVDNMSAVTRTVQSSRH